MTNSSLILEVVTEVRKTGEKSSTKFQVSDMEMAQKIIKRMKSRRVKILSANVVISYKLDGRD